MFLKVIYKGFLNSCIVLYASETSSSNHYVENHTVQPGSFSTVGSFSIVDPVVGRICLQCKY